MARVRANVAKAANELEMILGRLQRRIRAEAPNDWIALSQMTVLNRLVRNGPDTASGLSAAEHVRAQSMAQTIANLESQGLVARTADPDDRRRVLVSATAEGRALVQAVHRSRQAWIARAMATCFSEEEQEALVKSTALLARLVDCDPDTGAGPNGAPTVTR